MFIEKQWENHAVKKKSKILGQNLNAHQGLRFLLLTWAYLSKAGSSLNVLS